MKFFLLLFLFFVTACSCQFHREKLTNFQGHSMNMSWQVKISDYLNNCKRKEVEELIAETFHEIDTIFNNWNPHSEISAVNRLAQGQVMVLSKPLATFLSQVDSFVKRSNYRFDPTVHPLVKLYKEFFCHQMLAPQERVDELFGAIGWSKIHLEEGKLWKEHSFTSIDLCGVAKGHTIDLISEKLTQKGYQNFYVEWGGEVRASGCNGSGKPWRVGILGVGVIDLQDQALATSGDYYQQWRVGEQFFTHIINPQTKLPLEVTNHSITQATVLANSCAEADAFATALLLFPSSDIAKQWAQKENLTCWIVDHSEEKR